MQRHKSQPRQVFYSYGHENSKCKRSTKTYMSSCITFKIPINNEKKVKLVFNLLKNFNLNWWRQNDLKQSLTNQKHAKEFEDFGSPF